MARSGSPVARCAVCRRRRSIWRLIPIEVSRDIDTSGLLVVCHDRHGCRNLYMPIPALIEIPA